MSKQKRTNILNILKELRELCMPLKENHELESELTEAFKNFSKYWKEIFPRLERRLELEEVPMSEIENDYMIEYPVFLTMIGFMDGQLDFWETQIKPFEDYDKTLVERNQKKAASYRIRIIEDYKQDGLLKSQTSLAEILQSQIELEEKIQSQTELERIKRQELRYQHFQGLLMNSTNYDNSEGLREAIMSAYSNGYNHAIQSSQDVTQYSPDEVMETYFMLLGMHEMKVSDIISKRHKKVIKKIKMRYPIK